MLKKLFSLAGQKWVLGRTKILVWQNRLRNLEAWQKIICKLRLAGQHGRKAWYSSLAEHMPPLGRKKFWQEAIEFWQDEVVGPL